MTDAELIREARESAHDWPKGYSGLIKRLADALSRAAGEIERAKGERAKLRFPTMLRKMWSGGEVQAWLDEQLNQPPDERPTKEETSAVVQLMREKREILKANGYLNVERDKAVDRALSAEAEAAALRADKKVLQQTVLIAQRQLEQLGGAMHQEFCCELAWKAAHDKAWADRSGKCDCDAHVEYCEKCYPLDFRPGGKWSNNPLAARPDTAKEKDNG